MSLMLLLIHLINMYANFRFMKFICLIWTAFVILCSCADSQKKRYTDLLQEWMNREIQIPANSVFTVLARDTVDYPIQGDYKVLTYVDSVGCLSCKLQLDRWKELMEDDGLSGVNFLFFFSPEKMRDIVGTLRSNGFTHPVCIDRYNHLNRLNHFPADPTFQTFLLDKNNRVLAVGNPVHNPKVKELYLKIIRGESGSQEKKTPRSYAIAEVDRKEADMGRFYWREERTAEFVLKNTGRIPLVIQAVNTSCGCTRVEYDEKPARSGESIVLRVTYKANHPGHFRKLVTVFCNTEKGMLRLMVTGEAEERKK